MNIIYLNENDIIIIKCVKQAVGQTKYRWLFQG